MEGPKTVINENNPRTTTNKMGIVILFNVEFVFTAGLSRPGLRFAAEKKTLRAVAMACVIPEVAVTFVLVIIAIVFYRICATVRKICQFTEKLQNNNIK